MNTEQMVDNLIITEWSVWISKIQPFKYSMDIVFCVYFFTVKDLNIFTYFDESDTFLAYFASSIQTIYGFSSNSIW